MLTVQPHIQLGEELGLDRAILVGDLKRLDSLADWYSKTAPYSHSPSVS